MGDQDVDWVRLREHIDWQNLSEMEKILCTGVEWDYQRLLREVEEDPSLARLKWSNNSTLLHCAANDGQPALVRLLLSYGADVHAFQTGDGTPLHSAAGSGNIEVVELLLRAGASVAVRDDRGLTPLYWASITHNDGIVKLLMESGAIPDDEYSIKYVESQKAHGLL